MPCHVNPTPEEIEASRRNNAKNRRLDSIAHAIACSIDRTDFVSVDFTASDPESGLTKDDIEFWREHHREADRRAHQEAIVKAKDALKAAQAHLNRLESQ